MPELELVVKKANGGSHIPGWSDGRTLAVITHKGRESSREYTREYTDMMPAMEAMGRIELYENLELVSARMIIDDGTEPPTLLSTLISARYQVRILGADQGSKGGYSHSQAQGMAVLICSVFRLNSYYRSLEVAKVTGAITGDGLITGCIDWMRRTGRIPA